LPLPHRGGTIANMHGLMQDAPLTTNMIFRRAEQFWGARTVTTRTTQGIEHVSYTELLAETRRLAGALDSLGLAPDAQVGSFAWNTARHIELYFAVPGTGRVLHTVNIRYFADQLVYTIEHAEDEALFVDRSLLPVLEPLLPRLPKVRHVVVMEDGTPVTPSTDARIIDWADVVDTAAEIDFSDRVRDEQTAAALCYTTGTTGLPKGVLYSHRSTWLHANAGLSAAGSAITDRDNVMPVVPMFHAMGWGLPYTALMAGAAMTMPGPDLSPAALLELMASERVTYAAGVPTIWMGMLPLVGDYDLSHLDRVMCGGSAVPRSLSEAWRAAVGMPIMQGWGMTETSPVASLSTLRAEFVDAPPETQAAVRATVGLPLVGLEVRIVDTAMDQIQPWDDESTGEIQIRGPWVAREYFHNAEGGEQFTEDGWLRTGDVGAVSPLGYLRLVDRTKDLVKSGGEWISTVELENHLMAHPAVAEAAVIAVPHPRWMERPLACVVLRPGQQVDRSELLEFLTDRVASWQIPDDVVFIDEIPKTSVGKFSKRTLRERFADYRLPTA
jgi:fatty-acyl-CoA synthase